MTDTSENGRERAPPPQSSAEVMVCDLKAWFVREVLPLEADLVRFLRRHGHAGCDVNDLRQETWLRAYESARERLPQSTRPFLFAIARNILVDQYRRARIVPIDRIPDFDFGEIPSDEPGPDRSMIARDELHRLYAVLDRLPPRCREAVVMRRVDQLSRREIAARMGIAEKTVKRHLNDGLRLLIAMLYGEPADRQDQP
jgi:RNA polymerase sigma factor (sigma-70 family)